MCFKTPIEGNDLLRERFMHSLLRSLSTFVFWNSVRCCSIVLLSYLPVSADPPNYPFPSALLIQPRVPLVQQGTIAEEQSLSPGNGAGKTSAAVKPHAVTSGEESLLMRRAETYFKNSDIVAARLVLRDLGKRGSAAAAFMLGKSYDPRYAVAFNVRNSGTNAAEAAEWYRRSAELGNKDAKEALLLLAAK